MKILNPNFSHIYIEESIIYHQNTKMILSKFNNPEIVEINHYKDVFSLPNQNFVMQKQTPKLILAKNNDLSIYKGSPVCDNFGNENFYYISSVKNCFYDCEYCFLQGMYSSANIVVFVNIEDIFFKLEKMLRTENIYICISYDTDLLAFENILGFCEKWIEFANKHKNLKVELRTKSSNYNFIKNITPIENFILAWTVSPEEVISKYENKTPNLKSRITNIEKAIIDGWNVRICFDPVLYIESWEEIYSKMIDNVFSKISNYKLFDVSIGSFRVSKNYLKNMRKQRQNSQILNFPFEIKNNLCLYNKLLNKKMFDFIFSKITNYLDSNKIWINDKV